MKRAIILHGTDGSPTELEWRGWLEETLERSGYEVFFPQLPDCHRPNLKAYDDFLQKSGWDFSGNILVGHSSGATATLHLLQQDWFPKVEATILVGVFLNEQLLVNAPWYTKGQFDHLFVDTLNINVIKTKSNKFYFVHGDDDPYCDFTQARMLCEDLGGEFITMEGAGHIAKTAAIPTLPLLQEALCKDGYIVDENN